MKLARILPLGCLLAVSPSSGNSCTPGASFTGNGSWRLEYPPWGEPGTAMYGEKPLYIPIIGPLTGHSCMWSRYMAIRLAASHLNRRDATFCPAIGELTHSFEVQYDIQDSQASGAGAILAIMQHLEQDTKAGVTPGTGEARVKVVLGPNSSGESKGLHGFLGGAFQIPYMSWAATSPDLSDKNEFGYFWRMVPSDQYSMQQMAVWLRWLYPNETNLVVEAIYIEDGSVAERQFQSFRTAATALSPSITINSYPVPSSSSASGSRMNAQAEQTARSNLDQIERTQNRLGAIFAQSAEMIGLLNLTREKKMDQGPGWLWIGGDGLTQIFGQGAEADALTRVSVRGFVYAIAGTAANEWDQYKDMWRTHMCQTQIPEHAFTVCSGTVCNTSSKMTPVDVGDRCLNSWMQEAYVSMVSFAVVADRLITSTGKDPADFTNSDWTAGLRTLETTPMHCMSGMVELGNTQERLMGVFINQYQGDVAAVSIARIEAGAVRWLGQTITWAEVNGTDVTPSELVGALAGPTAEPPNLRPPTCQDAGQVYNLQQGECVSCDDGAVAISTGAKPKECVCDPGKQGENSTACTSCTVGKFKPDPGFGDCIDCEAGKFSSLAGQTACQSCPVGRYSATSASTECTSCADSRTTDGDSNEDSSSCICKRDYYQEGSDCLACPSGGVTAGSGQIGLKQCLCPTDKYKPVDDPSACRDCPEGMKCRTEQSDGRVFGSVQRGGLTPEEYSTESQKESLEPRLEEKHWADAIDTLLVFECADAQRCPGDRLPGQACASTLTGRACEKCRPDYSWQDGTCVACSGLQSSGVIFPGIPLLVSPLIVALLYKMFGDTYDKWNSPMNGVASIMFTIINHYQIIYILRDADIVYSGSQETFIGSLGFTHDFTTLFNMECKGYGSLVARLIMRAVGPVVVAAVFALTWSISYLGDPRYHMEINRTLNGFFSLILTFFPGIVGGASVLFVCVSNTRENDLRSLTADRSIICLQAEWQSLLGIGISSVVLWVIGFGALFVRTVLVAPRWFHDRGAQMRWKFLFIKYRPDVHWWSLMLIAKGLLTNFVFVIFDSGEKQMYSLIVVALAYFVGAVAFMPWRHYLVNFCDLWLHQCLLQICTVLLWLVQKKLAETENRQLKDESWGVNYVRAMGWLPIPIAVLAAGHMLWNRWSRWARGRRAKQVQKIKATLYAVKQHSEEDMLSFMASLTDWDNLCLDSAMKVFVTDYIGLRVRNGLSQKSSVKDVEHNRKSIHNLLASGTFSAKTSRRSSWESSKRLGSNSSRGTFASRDRPSSADEPGKEREGSMRSLRSIDPETKVSV